MKQYWGGGGGGGGGLKKNYKKQKAKKKKKKKIKIIKCQVILILLKIECIFNVLMNGPGTVPPRNMTRLVV
jgi:hypothetical protein